MHCFVSGIGIMGPRYMRHKSNIIVTSIAAPKESIATLARSHRSPGFSSILQKVGENQDNELNHNSQTMGEARFRVQFTYNRKKKILDWANSFDGYIGSKD